MKEKKQDEFSLVKLVLMNAYRSFEERKKVVVEVEVVESKVSEILVCEFENEGC